MMKKAKVFKVVKWLLLLGVLGVLFSVALIFYADHAATKAAEGKLYDDAGDVPEADVALVFGCNKSFQGRRNLYFMHRIAAAVELWKEGRVRCFIVSGDNHSHDYNEPEDMKAALVEAGVPAEKIVCDFAGLRTLDSVVRAKEIFGAEKVILISQKFHNQRAAYLAESIGLEVVGLNAQSVTGPAARKTDTREKLARVKMWLDVNVLKTDPKFLGQKEKLPL
ncbi:MAG: ElyC/SanA/YdcF family protein [Akkermansiaceae bacterium]|nr:ElyC/SanA/YdcF family protein [Akkermansiaceae bacterium]